MIIWIIYPGLLSIFFLSPPVKQCGSLSLKYHHLELHTVPIGLPVCGSDVLTWTCPFLSLHLYLFLCLPESFSSPSFHPSSSHLSAIFLLRLIFWSSLAIQLYFTFLQAFFLTLLSALWSAIEQPCAVPMCLEDRILVTEVLLQPFSASLSLWPKFQPDRASGRHGLSVG